ncbi:hemerythrin domain-containing protein [Frankia sp. CcWB3]
MTVSKATRERTRASQLPEDDVVGILLAQHAEIRELFGKVRTSTGQRRQETFDKLRALLAAHETGEEVVLRPISRQVVGPEVTDARNREEKAASRDLAGLDRMDASSVEFEAKLAAFEHTVVEHAEREEREEFEALRQVRPESELVRLGRRLRAIQAIAPTHPHPSVAGSPTAQRVFGPAVSLVDRLRDARRQTTTAG